MRWHGKAALHLFKLNSIYEFWGGDRTGGLEWGSRILKILHNLKASCLYQNPESKGALFLICSCPAVNRI